MLLETKCMPAKVRLSKSTSQSRYDWSLYSLSRLLILSSLDLYTETFLSEYRTRLKASPTLISFPCVCLHLEKGVDSLDAQRACHALYGRCSLSSCVWYRRIFLRGPSQGYECLLVLWESDVGAEILVAHHASARHATTLSASFEKFKTRYGKPELTCMTGLWLLRYGAKEIIVLPSMRCEV